MKLPKELLYITIVCIQKCFLRFFNSGFFHKSHHNFFCQKWVPHCKLGHKFYLKRIVSNFRKVVNLKSHIHEKFCSSLTNANANILKQKSS